jgi:phospholipid/cholesterol/gamma-HCH transport system permease protein
MNSAADFRQSVDGDRAAVRFSGDLTLATLSDLPKRLEQISGEGMLIDLSQVSRMDTVGAWLVHRLARDRNSEIVGANQYQATLLEQVGHADKAVKIRADRTPPLYRVLNQIGGATATAGRTMLGLLGFFGALLIALWGVITHPRRFRVNAVTQQFELLGIHSLGIVGLMSFLVGIVIAQQGAVQLRQFGAEVFTVNLVGRSAVKELGILMTAIMVAGRSGSAFAAQIGSMKLAEEVDAMRTIGFPRWRHWSSPRACRRPDDAAARLLFGHPGDRRRRALRLDRPRHSAGDFRAADQRSGSDHRSLADADQGAGLRPDHRHGRLLPGHAGRRRCRGGRASHHGCGRQGIFLVIVLDAFFAVFFTSIGWL